MIVSNTDKNTSGHIQADADYGGVIGVFSAPDKDDWFDFFIYLDYFNFTAERQLVSDDVKIDLGTEVSGTV